MFGESERAIEEGGEGNREDARQKERGGGDKERERERDGERVTVPLTGLKTASEGLATVSGPG